MASGSDNNFWHKTSTRSSGSPLATDDLREFVESWSSLQAKIGTPNPPSNPSGAAALSESEAKAFVEGVETARGA
jgi:hypothetical protein